MSEQSKVWVAPAFLDWPARAAGAYVQDEGLFLYHYEIWRHAQDLLTGETGPHILTCCLFQLNRSVDFRDKLLNQIYRFRQLPGMKGKSQHQIMEELGIVKPLMRKKLDDVRNSLMHQQGSKVPPATECAEFAEFVWYFLKSTDRLAAVQVMSIEFGDEEPGNESSEDGASDSLPFRVPWAEFDVDDIAESGWHPRLQGVFPREQISEAAVDGWIPVQLTEERKYYSRHNSASVESELCSVWGKVVVDPNSLLPLILRYFNTY